VALAVVALEQIITQLAQQVRPTRAAVAVEVVSQACLAAQAAQADQV